MTLAILAELSHLTDSQLNELAAAVGAELSRRASASAEALVPDAAS